ncbi:MAG: MFS transporter [Dehalococcoidia bacterium]
MDEEGTATDTDAKRPAGGVVRPRARVVVPRRRVGLFDAFRIRSFRFQWPADGLTIWAFEMETLVLGWYILEATDRPALVGLIGALRFGGTLFGPLYGVLADRFNRRRLLIADRALLAALALVLTALALSGSLRPWHAFLLAALTGIGRNLDNVVRQALLADVIPPRTLANALALNRSVMDMSRMAGALLGGSLLAALGIGEAYVGVCFLYLGSSLLSTGISLRQAADRVVVAGWLSNLREGAAYIRRDEAMVAPLALAFLVNLTLFPTVNGLMPVVAREVFDKGPNGLALLQVAAGLGALMGSMSLAGFNRSARPARVMVLNIALWHVSVAGFALVGWWWAALAVLVVFGATQSFAMITMATGLLRAAPVEFRGRVMGVRSLAVYGLPIGLLVGGFTAEQFGVRTALLINGCVGLVATGAAVLKWPGLLRAPRRDRAVGSAEAGSAADGRR